MGLPPSLVKAAAQSQSTKSQLHQQALANLNRRDTPSPALETRDNFLTPPQTPVSSLSWKGAAAANAAAAASLVVPEPHKPDPR